MDPSLFIVGLCLIVAVFGIVRGQGGRIVMICWGVVGLSVSIAATILGTGVDIAATLAGFVAQLGTL